MECKICGFKTDYYFKKNILGKYDVTYYRCKHCGLIQTEKPFWLKEAYSSAIIDSDTGILSRNIALSKITAIICLLLLNKNSKVLDYGGGYGILTRLLRDIGMDCYWTDKYAENIFAKGFEDKNISKYDMVTAFELFEHLENPVEELVNIFGKFQPQVLLFSTVLHKGTPSKNWWYFVPEGGQHITLYTKKSLEIIAERLGLKLSTNNNDIHILSKKKFSTIMMYIISVFFPFYSMFYSHIFKSKTTPDHKFLGKKI
ncbi:MAG: Glycosyl transferase, family 2 [uncultured bacterium]|nr:MAG: Glycosyl transferase, family 2 [uncultured bacterium]